MTTASPCRGPRRCGASGLDRRRGERWFTRPFGVGCGPVSARRSAFRSAGPAASLNRRSPAWSAGRGPGRGGGGEAGREGLSGLRMIRRQIAGSPGS